MQNVATTCFMQTVVSIGFYGLSMLTISNTAIYNSILPLLTSRRHSVSPLQQIRATPKKIMAKDRLKKHLDPRIIILRCKLLVGLSYNRILGPKNLKGFFLQHEYRVFLWVILSTFPLIDEL